MSLNETRESSAGFHWVACYQQCPRQFFIKYILGYLPERIPQYLVMGKVFHNAAAFVAEFDTKGDLEWEVLQASMKADFDREAQTLDLAVDPVELYATLETFVKCAIPTWAKDREAFRYIAIEKEILVPLANGFLMTQRHDADVMDANGDIWVIERKTTQSSDTGMLRQVNNEDQATAYVLGAKRVSRELWGVDSERVIGVIPEVSYVKASVSRTVVGDPIIPTQWQLDEYEARTIGLMSEIGQKTEFLRQGVPAEVLFGRAPKLCSGFLKCEYESICKRFLSGEESFEGFRRDEAIDYTGPRADPKAYLEWVRKEASR